MPEAGTLWDVIKIGVVVGVINGLFWLAQFLFSKRYSKSEQDSKKLAEALTEEELEKLCGLRHEAQDNKFTVTVQGMRDEHIAQVASLSRSMDEGFKAQEKLFQAELRVVTTEVRSVATEVKGVAGHVEAVDGRVASLNKTMIDHITNNGNGKGG